MNYFFSSPIPRLPPNPSRVDRLIIDHLREHSRIATLCFKMEQLRGKKPLHGRVAAALNAWLDAIRKVQVRKSKIRATRDSQKLRQSEKKTCGGIDEKRFLYVMAPTLGVNYVMVQMYICRL